MKKADLLKKPEYEIKLAGAGTREVDEKLEQMVTCNIQIFDMDRKVTVKSVSGVMGFGIDIRSAEDSALERACELLGEA